MPRKVVLKMNPIDKNTYGSSKAAVVLAKLVGDNKNYSRRVSRCFQDFTTGINAIYQIKDKEIRNEVCYMWLKKHKERALNSNLPEAIRTYLANVEQTYMKPYVGYYRKMEIKNKGEKDAVHKK